MDCSQSSSVLKWKGCGMADMGVSRGLGEGAKVGDLREVWVAWVK